MIHVSVFKKNQHSMMSHSQYDALKSAMTSQAECLNNSDLVLMESLIMEFQPVKAKNIQ